MDWLELLFWWAVVIAPLLSLLGPAAFVLALLAYKQAKRNAWEIRRIDSCLLQSIEAEQKMSERMFSNQAGQEIECEIESIEDELRDDE